MTALLLISSIIAIVVSFLCSLAEAMLLSLNPLLLNRLQATRPRTAESWRRLKRNVARPITAILVLNTVAHTGGAIVAGGAFAEIYGEQNIWIFSILHDSTPAGCEDDRKQCVGIVTLEDIAGELLSTDIEEFK